MTRITVGGFLAEGMPREWRSWWRAVRVGALALVAGALLGGCASGQLPPPRPMEHVQDVAGRWEGMANVRRQVMLWRVNITPEGGLTIQYGVTTLWGAARVAGGVARWEASTMSGRLTLYGEGTDRILEMVDDWGSLYVRMTPVK